MLNVCIGYDESETVAFYVLAHSIITRASQPIKIIPINKDMLPEYTRGKDDGSTAFTYTRFLTPFLSGYVGQSLFLDADMLCLCDITEVLEYTSTSTDISVVKHPDYEPVSDTKFLGNAQRAYPRKNWSSFIVFNNFAQACRRLTPEVVNTQSGAYLHQFKWSSDERIGGLPIEYNHLVGEAEPNPDAKIVHYTLGTPCFAGYEDQEFATEWFAERERMLAHD